MKIFGSSIFHCDIKKLADVVLKKTGNTKYAGLVYLKAADAETETVKLVNVVKKLVEDIGDTTGALEVLQKAENSVKTNGEFIIVAEAIISYATDPGWLSDITLQKEKREQYPELYDGYIKREQEAESGAALYNLAHTVIQETGDLPYGRKVFVNAEQKTTQFPERLELAGLVAEDTGDVVWAKELYVGLLGKAETFVDKKNIAEAVMDRLGDEEQAKEMLVRMEEEAVSSSDYLKLATIVFQILQDRPMTNNLLQTALMRSGDRFTLLTIAGFIVGRLKETEWGFELYDKAVEMCSDRFQYEHVFSIVETQASNETIMKNLHRKVERHLVTAEDYMFLAESVSRRLDDTAWAAELYRKAEMAPELQRVKFKLMDSVSNYLGDRSLIARIFKA